MIEAYPLYWPPAWPRTKHPDYARFKTSFGRARNQLLRELNLLGATNIVISSNIALRRDGIPYSGQRQPEDTGIAVYFDLNGENQCIPCDKWMHTEDNIHAINLTVAALRGLERWGAKEMVNAAFRGFKALPASIIVGAHTKLPWHEVLEVVPTASIETIKAAYRQMLLKHHPDHGGDIDKFHEIQAAYKEALSQ